MRANDSTRSLTIQPLIREVATDCYKVRSKSHPNASHTVRCEDGHIRCNCPATRRCWHVKEVQEYRFRLAATAPQPVRPVVPRAVQAPSVDVWPSPFQPVADPTTDPGF